MAKSRTINSSPIRRTYKVATSRFFLIPLVIISLIFIGVLFYYYNLYTQIIDARLRGDVFVRASGIYAAPLNLHAGSSMRMNALLSHLRSVGYLEGGATQNERRGQYAVRGNVVEIYPGGDAMISGEKAFNSLRVTFGREGAGIQSITDIDSRQKIDKALVEPELISSVINQEREKRKNIEYKDLPPKLIYAIVAIEDRQFYEHPGINWRGILRALIRDYQVGEFREGGSSMTQQLVKNFFLKPDRTLKRKLAEAYMSILLEQRLSKEQIMAMYCNQIYLGQRGGFSINGFGQAARAYFGKDISNLTLAESAFLSGIIRSPNYYSPYTNPERATERRNLVLEKILEVVDNRTLEHVVGEVKITRATVDESKRQPLGVVGKASGVDASDAPYFVDYLMRQLETQYPDGELLRSMRVYSTIDLGLQRAAYQAVDKNMREVERLLARRKGGIGGLQVALVAMNAKTGDILAMVGGKDYASSQLNRATDAKRQPGSAFKPFVYAAALELGIEGSNIAITPATMFMDAPRTFDFDGKIYDPGNFNDKYEGRPLTARDALVDSKNVITVEIAQRIGYSQVSRFAERAGFPKVPPYPSAALGVGEATPLQVTAAYTPFANKGVRASPISIKRVTSKDGAILLESKIETREVMTPQVAYIMTSMMEDVIDRGTGKRVRAMGFNGVAAGKTGTSRDAWFAGYTPNMVCVVWVGFDDYSDIGLTGAAAAAPIWADFMKQALEIRPELGGKFVAPEEGIVTYEIDPMTGQPSPGGANVRRELFLTGTESNGEALPDSSIPDPEPPPAKIDGETPRPTPTPRPPNSDGQMSGIDDDQVPLPPEARKGKTNPPPQPTPNATGNRPSFFKKLTTAIGITSSDSAKPQPTPTPWTQAGLDPVTRATPRPVPTPLGKSSASTKSNAEVKPTATPGPIVFEVKKTPAPAPTPKPAPIATPAPPTSKQIGTFVLEVCQVTGLLPVNGVCQTTTRKRFQLGTEPTVSCSADAHRRKSR